MSVFEAAAPTIVRTNFVRRLAIVAAIFFAVFFVIGALTKPAKNVKLASAVDFKIENLNGDGSVSFNGAAGKPTVVNFFASWCIPCRRELPRFAQASQDFGSDVSFVGVDHQDSRSMARDLLATFNVTYPAGYDPTGSVAKKYGLTVGLPATVFINAKGKIVHQEYGEVGEAELNSWLEKIAGTK